MAHKVLEDCVYCGCCLDACPADAILDGDSIYEVVPENCTDCGLCAEACPIDQIVPA